MTIDAIAQEAQVAAQTVYAVFGSKTRILAELLDQTSFGPDYQELVRQARETVEPVARLHFAARIARQVHDTQSPAFDLLRGAGVVAPDLAQLEKEREDRRYGMQEGVVICLSRSGRLRAGLDFASARDVLWSLTGRELYRMLVRERNWPSQAYEDWLAETLVAALLVRRKRLSR
jgi:AcrR family transcriptional regulator